ncbi:MAG: FG-GAP-like repeat-containing protein [Bacteroidota bacterium]
MKRSFFLIMLILFILSFEMNYAQINFQDQASARGVGASCGIIDLGGGVSFFDYNNDGWDDITLATQESENLGIYKNTQDGFFILETNLNPNNTFQQKQPVWVDFDNDGDFDLYVTSDVDGNRLYLNNGNSLMDITSDAGLPLPNLFTYGSSWGDYNNDGYLDVFVSNRDVNFQIPNYLFKNNGDGTFTNVSLAAGIGMGSHLSFCAAFFDYNNDGWQDIYVANDKIQTRNLLYHNNGDGTFTEVGQSSGTDVAIDAMSTTIGDYNNDGWFDIYVTNGPEGNVLFRNNTDGTFTDEALTSGTIFNSTGWGAVFLDAENDGDQDLYVSGSSNGGLPNILSAAFYDNQSDGTFSLLSNGSFSNDNLESYANAIGDIDNDGYPEIVVSNSGNGDLFLWKNLTLASNNWLKIKLEGTTSNRQGIGSMIEISVDGQKQYRYTLCGEGYMGQNSASEFFGLGQHTVLDYVKVKWLSGIEDILYHVPVNQTVTVVEGSSLSIADHNQRLHVYFDNPVKDMLHIRASRPMEGYVIFDSIGKEIMRGRVSNHQTRINIEQLRTGIYYCKLSFLEHSQKVIRVVKH